MVFVCFVTEELNGGGAGHLFCVDPRNFELDRLPRRGRKGPTVSLKLPRIGYPPIFSYQQLSGSGMVPYEIMLDVSDEIAT
jgi:hypothetical protein